MPPVVDPHNLYSEIGPSHLSPALKGDLERVYVPNLRTNDVSVIDPATMKVVDRFKVGVAPAARDPVVGPAHAVGRQQCRAPQHGSLTPIDPRTGKPGADVPVDDPYNMYFTPDGKSAIVVAEARHRLDFRDPQTMAMQYSIDVPQCGGINHADFSIDGKYALFTCEFDGSIAKIDLVEPQGARLPEAADAGDALPRRRRPDRRRAPTEICTSKKGMPQDIRFSPDGKLFYVADMDADGVHVVDGDSFKEVGFVPTGVGTHGLYPSRDGK